MGWIRTFAAFVIASIAAAAPAFALTVSISTTVEGGGTPQVIGQTNLPDGTRLMVTISRRASSYIAQADALVSKGSFQAGPFSQFNKPLNPGTYTIEISSPLATLQPPEVRGVIGESGELIDGPLVKPSKFGGKVIEYKSKFKIGTGVASTAQDQAAKEADKKAQHEWWLESCQSNCDLVQNYSKATGQAFDWQKCHSGCLKDEPE